jgi:uncharacterized protein YfaT (DUF1175 family)
VLAKRRLLCVILLAAAGAGCGPSAIALKAVHDRLPADGFASTELIARTSTGEVIKADFSVIRGSRIIRIEGSRARSTINPGTAIIEARYGKETARAAVMTAPVYTDRAADGTPDFLRLDDPADLKAFVDSFAYIAEAQYFRADKLPVEISDCSALIRYAYRETLREHNGEWTTVQPSKYHYPFTPLGAKLFRTQPGPFRESDVAGNAFAEFADAESLRRFNTHFISRDIHQARRGDLLFYRQPDQRSPAHAMIFMAGSQIDNTHDRRVVYHTGPIGRDKGEIRRPAIRELMQHPQPQWRPTPGNSNFVGVYRWNILRQES